MATEVDKLIVRIEADMADLKRELEKVGKQTETVGKRMQDAFKRVGQSLVALAGTAALFQFGRSIVNTGIQVDVLTLKMRTMFGSAEEGAKAFAILDKFASKVPFSLEEISAGAGPLSIVAGKAENLTELLTITGNIAALTGRPFNEMAIQVQRAMSAGINSAELLRDDGIKAMLGFKDGVTISVGETVKALREGFGQGGKFDGIMDDLAVTAKGAMSMAGDAIFQLQKIIFASGVGEAIVQLSMAFKDLVIAFTPLLSVIGILAKALAGVLAPAMKLVADNADILSFAIGVLIARMIALKAATAALGLIAAAKAFSTAAIAAHGATTALTGVQSAIVVVIAVVKRILPLLLTFLKRIFIPFAIIASIYKVANAIYTVWKNSKDLGEMWDNIKRLIKDFATFMVAKFEVIKLKIEGIGIRIRYFFTGLGQLIADFIKTKMNDVIREINPFLEKMRLGRIDEFQTSEMRAQNEPDYMTEIEKGQIALANNTKEIEAATEKADGAFAGLKQTMIELGLLKPPIQEQTEQTKSDAFELADVVTELTETMTPTMQAFFDTASKIGDGVVSSFRKMLDGTKLTLSSFKDLIKAAVRDLIAQLFRLMVVNKIINAMFGGVTGFEKLPTMPFFFGGKAGGGKLNGPQLVGERGPELYFPNTGRIANNHDANNMLGGNSTIVNQTINVETGVSQTVRAEMLSLLPRFKQDTMAAVVDAKRRGGSYGSAFG